MSFRTRLLLPRKRSNKLYRHTPAGGRREQHGSDEDQRVQDGLLDALPDAADGADAVQRVVLYVNPPDVQRRAQDGCRVPWNRVSALDRGVHQG